MSDKNLVAVLIAVVMGLWLLSGELGSPNAHAAETDETPTNQQLPLVRGVQSHAKLHVQYLEVRGQTRANRVVQVRAEIAGRIEAIPGIKGTVVKAGDLLCKLAVDTRESDLAQARANLRSAALEYQGVQDLKRRGLQSDITVAKSRATLEASRAAVKRAELNLARTKIVAPFAGVVETQPVEIGDYLSTGQVCVTLMEVQPMLVTGQVAEKNVEEVKLGDEVTVSLITGESLTGKVTFVARAPDQSTRTFPIEVTVDNPDNRIRAGLTAEMKVPVAREQAHLISPAAMVLNDKGIVGVRIVDDTNTVRFKPIKVLSESPDGVWVVGLPEEITLITVGQETVFEGQKVRVDLSPLGTVVRS